MSPLFQHLLAALPLPAVPLIGALAASAAPAPSQAHPPHLVFPGHAHPHHVVQDADHRRERGFIGVTIDEAGEDGVRIVAILEGQAAEGAGLKAGDVIVELDGDKVRGMEDLGELLAGTEPGDEVEVCVLRDGESCAIPVRLGRRPHREEAAEADHRRRLEDAERARRAERHERHRRHEGSDLDDYREEMRHLAEDFRRRAEELGKRHSDTLRRHLEIPRENLRDLWERSDGPRFFHAAPGSKPLALPFFGGGEALREEIDGLRDEIRGLREEVQELRELLSRRGGSGAR